MTHYILHRSRLWLALVFVASSLLAQEAPVSKPVRQRNIKEIDLFYNFSHVGGKIVFNYNHFFGRHGITGGLHYQLGTRIRNNRSAFEGYRFVGEESGPSGSTVGGFFDRFDFNFGYKFNLRRSPQPGSLHPYLFYQFQINRSLYAKDTRSGVTTSPYTVFEHTVGAGIAPQLYKRFYGNLSAAIGNAKFKQGSVISSSNDINYNERAVIFRLGITYRLAGN